ncbi:hypothetical protein NDU88_005657 [Pleurodeles waltl]|uniref:Uncharacterized protein n=1 Tax=Pleurodeles waltl TaxID=8319 RepID=A0AAV7WBA2_PLEWA|nr:hypothetical protein NDU88_005657 [Pleurodeles waltl]
MTSRPVKNRINEHRSNIRCNRITTKLSAHFLEATHSPDDLCCADFPLISIDTRYLFRVFPSVFDTAFTREDFVYSPPSMSMTPRSIGVFRFPERLETHANPGRTIISGFAVSL